MRVFTFASGRAVVVLALALLLALATPIAAKSDVITIRGESSVGDRDLRIVGKSVGSSQTEATVEDADDIRIGGSNTHVVAVPGAETEKQEAVAAPSKIAIAEDAEAVAEAMALVEEQERLEALLAADQERKAKFSGRRHGSVGPTSSVEARAEEIEAEHTLKYSAEMAANAKRATLLNADSAVTMVNEAVNVCVLQNDVDPDGAQLDLTSLEIVSAPLHGTAVVDHTEGKVSYTPNTDFSGMDSFTYVVCDTQAPPQCATAVAEITVIANVECTDYLGMPIQTVDFCLLCWANDQITTFIDDEIIPGLMELRWKAERYSPFDGIEIAGDNYVLDQRVYSHALRAFAVDECLDAEELIEGDEWVYPFYSPNGLDSLHAFHELNTMILATLVEAGESLGVAM